MSFPLARLSLDDQALFRQFSFGPIRTVHISILHHAFRRHAIDQPDAIAVEHLSLNESISYRQLDIQSNRLAHRLRKQCICPGFRVCILARRSIVLIVAILAVLKSGAQYIPLDAMTITDETLQFVLEDSSPSMVLTMVDYLDRISECPAPVVCLEHFFQKAEFTKGDLSEVEDISSPSDSIYCIYTSGTTGRPKGVDVKHEGVTNVISGAPANVGMRRGMRVAQLLNIAFDMGAWEILGSLYNGCTLCLRGNTFKDWVDVLKTVNIVISTPSILMRHSPEDYPNIQHVIVGGEPCPQSLADKWAAYTSFNNCCGPTEISICNTVQPHALGNTLSIGKPIPNTNVYILSCDENAEPLPIGHVGSMWVGGIGTNTRYLNLPKQIGERWRKDPFVRGGVMFNTGDLGRWRADGQLDHMGRVDDQVKIKGFRVELDGVSAAMQTCEGISGAATLLVDSELWGFVTPSTVDTASVRETVSKIQPYYAVPTHFLALNIFPATRNGKIDKRALRSIALSSTLPHDVSTPCVSESSSPTSTDSEGIITPSTSRSNSLPSSDTYREPSFWTEISLGKSLDQTELAEEDLVLKASEYSDTFQASPVRRIDVFLTRQ
ncbi:putative nonribosomal peptide synthetase [Lentinula aciculospora]|uniref:Nonribosomal peptide synthetase n=1 Tax=Lentinula aciculospora TaxID=153920 RepID=A0A9W9DVM1_9AGAR|nr:putative nonribosomal peptide synthetase [Lentinula aciculospora]